MEHSNQFLGTERIGKLMKQYAIPCTISLLVGALYNIVDQIFIANASYLVFGVGFALLLPLFFGLDGVLYSMPVSDILTFIVAVFLIERTYQQLSEKEKETA